MRAILASIVVVTAILIIALPKLFHREQLAWHERRVERQIQELERQGAFTLPDSLDQALFSIPVRSFYFGSGYTYGQLRKDIARQTLAGTANLERSVRFVEYVRYIASAFARGTEYQDHISINQEPRPGFLNLYFVRHAHEFQGEILQTPQCSYLGFANAIVCDSDSIAKAFAELDQIPSNQSVVIAVLEEDGRLRVNMLGNLDVLRRLLKQNLLIWLIGHEIGHAIHDREWILSHDAPLHFTGLYNDRETNADAFVADVVEKDQLLGANFATLLLEFINQQFDQSYNSEYHRAPSFLPETKEPPLRVRTGRFSRPLLLRAIQVMVQVLKRDPSAMDRADYTVISGRLGYVHSIQFPERVTSVQSKMLVDVQPDGLRFTVPILSVAFAVATGCMLWLFRQREVKP